MIAFATAGTQAANPGIGAFIVSVAPIMLLSLAIYFIPTFVASKRKHPQKTPILLLNIFLGWTFIGWVVALIWATLKDKTQDINRVE